VTKYIQHFELPSSKNIYTIDLFLMHAYTLFIKGFEGEYFQPEKISKETSSCVREYKSILTSKSTEDSLVCICICFERIIYSTDHLTFIYILINY